jgi:methoxymalonate biosynthesis acyl carrier protein
MSVTESARAPESLQGQVASLLAETLHVEVLPETDLLETGMIDSVALVDLLVRIEERFGVRVDLENLQVDQFRSVAGIVSVVARAEVRAVGNSQTVERL